MQSEQPRAEQLTGSPQRRRAPYAVVAVLDARDNLLNGGGTSFEVHSDALRCTQMHSDALRCTQMHSDALRCTRMRSHLLDVGHELGHLKTH
jgi:hypothetical protein